LISAYEGLFYGLTVGDEFDGEAIGVGGLARGIPSAPPFQVSQSLEITLRKAQVRRISWVRRVRLAGARLSGLLVSAALRPAT
jgi:hypothetical protein